MSLMAARNAAIGPRRRSTLQLAPSVAPPRFTSPNLPQQPPPRARTAPLTGASDYVRERMSRVDTSQFGSVGDDEEQDDGSTFGRGLGYIFNNPVTRTVVKPLEVLDYGRRAAILGVEQAALALPDPAEALLGGVPLLVDEDKVREDERSALDKLQDPEYGFGQITGETGNKWLDRGIGFLGDVALDPLTYVGGIGFAGKAGKVAAGGRQARIEAIGKLQDAMLKRGARPAEIEEAIGRIGRGGYAAARPDELAEMGVRGGIRLTSNPVMPSRGRNVYIPRSERLTQPLSRARTAIGNRVQQTKTGRRIADVRVPEGFEPEYGKLFRGEGEGTFQGALTSARLEQMTRGTRGLLRPFQAQADQLAEQTRKMSREQRAKINDALELSGDATGDAADFEKFYDAIWKFVTDAGMPLSLRQNYSPHILSRDAVDWRRDPTNSGRIKAPTGFFTERRYDPSGVTMGRSLKPDMEFEINGNKFTLKNATIEEFNEKARAAGLDFDFFENDPGVIAQKYVNMLQDDFGLFKAAPELLNLQYSRGLIRPGVAYETSRTPVVMKGGGAKLQPDDATEAANRLGIDPNLADEGGPLRAEVAQPLTKQLNRGITARMRQEHDRAAANLGALRGDMLTKLKAVASGKAQLGDEQSVLKIAEETAERVDELTAEIGARTLEKNYLEGQIPELLDRADLFAERARLASDEIELIDEMLPMLQSTGRANIVRELRAKRDALNAKLGEIDEQVQTLTARLRRRGVEDVDAELAARRQMMNAEAQAPWNDNIDELAFRQQAVADEINAAREAGEPISPDVARRNLLATGQQPAELVRREQLTNSELRKLRNDARTAASRMLDNAQGELNRFGSVPQWPSAEELARGKGELDWARPDSASFKNYPLNEFFRRGYVKKPGHKTRKERVQSWRTLAEEAGFGPDGGEEAFNRYFAAVERALTLRSMLGKSNFQPRGQVLDNLVSEVADSIGVDRRTADALLRPKFGESRQALDEVNDETLKNLVDQVYALDPVDRQTLATAMREFEPADREEVLMEMLGVSRLTPAESDALAAIDPQNFADLLDVNAPRLRPLPERELQARIGQLTEARDAQIAKLDDTVAKAQGKVRRLVDSGGKRDDIIKAQAKLDEALTTRIQRRRELETEFEQNVAELRRGPEPTPPPGKIEDLESVRSSTREAAARRSKIPTAGQARLPNVRPTVVDDPTGAQTGLRAQVRRGRQVRPKIDERELARLIEEDEMLAGMIAAQRQLIQRVKNQIESDPEVLHADWLLRRGSTQSRVVPGKAPPIPPRPPGWKPKGGKFKSEDIPLEDRASWQEVMQWSGDVEDIMSGVPFKRVPRPSAWSNQAYARRVRRAAEERYGLRREMEKLDELTQRRADVNSYKKRPYIGDRPEEVAEINKLTRAAFDPGEQQAIAELAARRPAEITRRAAEQITPEDRLEFNRLRAEAERTQAEVGDVNEQLVQTVKDPSMIQNPNQELLDSLPVERRQKVLGRAAALADREDLVGRAGSAERDLIEVNDALDAATSDLPGAEAAAQAAAARLQRVAAANPIGNPNRRIFTVDPEGTVTKGLMTPEDFLADVLQRDPGLRDEVNRATTVLLAKAEDTASKVADELVKFEETGFAARRKAVSRAVNFVLDETDWEKLSPEIFGADAPLIHSDLKRYLQKTRKAANDSRFWRAVDNMTGLFKTYATLTPGFHVRNALSGMFNNAADGVGVIDHNRARQVMKEFAKARDEGQDALLGWYARQGDVVLNSETGMTMRDALDAVAGSGAGGRYREHGIGDRSMARYRLNERAFENWLTHNVGKKPGAFIESTLRLPVAIDTMRAGGSRTDAMLRINRLHFDYSDTSSIDKKMRRLIPFWTFMSRNLPLQASLMATQPRTYAKYNSLKRNLQGEEVEGTPDYFEAIGAFRLADVDIAGYPIFLQPDLAHTRLEEDLIRYSDVSNPLGMMSDMNPYLTAPLEYAFGKDAFTGREFDDETDRRPAGLLETPVEWAGAALGLNETTPGGETTTPERLFNAARAMIPLYDRGARVVPQLVSGGGDEDAVARQVESMLRLVGVPARQLSPSQQQATLRSRYYDDRDEQRLQRRLAEIDAGG